MSKCDQKEFKCRLFELNSLLNRKNHDLNDVNLRLDIINSLDSKASFFEEENFEKLIVACCTSIPTNNSLLVAKSCNMILNHVLKCKITLSNENLKSLLHWTNEASQRCLDVAFLDILQVINALIKSHTDFFSENGCASVPFLFEQLENRTSLLQPNDVKLWRIHCLQALAKTMLKDDKTLIVNELINILYKQSTDNLLVHAKIWKLVIESLDCLAAKGNTKWLIGKLNDIIGIIEVSSILGLTGKEPLLPKQVFPSSVYAPEHTDIETSQVSSPNQPGKKKQKSKAKRINWVDKSDGDELIDKKNTFNSDGYQLPTLTSDSDYSDSECGQAAKLAKEQAKTRHAALNFIIRLSNVLRGNQLYGYYNNLINVLVQCLKSEITYKTKIAALAAVGALLKHSKSFLAQAQHSEGTSFVAFSASLSDLVSRLHASLGACLSTSPPDLVLVPLLHTVATLISVSPYHRLRPALINHLLSNMQPFLKHKDPAICVGAIKCLNEIVSLDPPTSEQRDILTRGLENSCSALPWILTFSFGFLKEQRTNETVRLACWQLLGNLCKSHFALVEECLPLLEELLFTDLKSSKTETQLYATYALNKLLEGIIGKENLESYNKELWEKLLQGPLISLLQSPELIACEACDCLANMGPIIFNSLKDEEQILVVTLIFGCVNHEKCKVRAAAVHTLGIFLLFPQISQEQFMYDARDLLIKSLRDEFVVVRIKSAWAIGNLVDLVVNNQDEEFVYDFNLKSILSASLKLTSDDDLVKSNILRAIGIVLSGLSEEHMNDKEMKTLLDNSVQFLLKCTTSSSKMKMRWNACHAIGTMMKNKELLIHSEKWMPGLIQSLCNLVVSCNNFKVRASACSVLCRIPSRIHFGILYSFVWNSLLDGLDNAANMPDFREYKHQDSLKQQLCLTICHVTTLLESDDIPELDTITNFRLQNLREHLVYFQNNTLPEQSGTLVTAANRLQELMQSCQNPQHRAILISLKEIFSVMNVR